MAKPVIINYIEDLPCMEWKDVLEVKCPMEKKWNEGETCLCLECGYKITFDENQEIEQGR